MNEREKAEAKAEEYLSIALDGNMNISTLKPKAWYEIMAGFAKSYRKAIMAERTCGKCRYTDTCSIEKVFHDSAIYENHKPEECFCIGFRPIVEPTEDEG